MLTHSTVSTVKSQLLTRLQARPNLAEVQVFYSWPADVQQAEAIYFGEARGEHTYPVLKSGRKPRQENYSLDIFIDVAGSGASSRETEERAWALASEVEDTIADDPTLGLTTDVIQAVAFGNWTLQYAVDVTREGWAAIIRVSLDVTARLA